MRNAFALRVDPGADIHFEWRDYKTGSPYLTGPQFQVRDGRLLLGDGRSLDLPVGDWVRFEIEDTLGTGDNGAWTLHVTRPGQPPQEFRDLPHGRPEFAQLTWIGFTSNANDTTAFYLDDFTLNGDE